MRNHQRATNSAWSLFCEEQSGSCLKARELGRRQKFMQIRKFAWDSFATVAAVGFSCGVGENNAWAFQLFCNKIYNKIGGNHCGDVHVSLKINCSTDLLPKVLSFSPSAWWVANWWNGLSDWWSLALCWTPRWLTCQAAIYGTGS